jgi:hypothetical protein
MTKFVCPVCGWDQLNEPPYYNDKDLPSYEGCPGCGFETGFHDDSEIYSIKEMIKRYRDRWIQEGMSWSSSMEMPVDWDPKKQLKNIGIEVE